jgi:hypothetical protein
MLRWLLHRRLTLPAAKATTEQGHAQYGGIRHQLVVGCNCVQGGGAEDIMLTPRGVRFEAVDIPRCLLYAKSSLAAELSLVASPDTYLLYMSK